MKQAQVEKPTQEDPDYNVGLSLITTKLRRARG